MLPDESAAKPAPFAPVTPTGAGAVAKHDASEDKIRAETNANRGAQQLNQIAELLYDDQKCFEATRAEIDNNTDKKAAAASAEYFAGIVAKHAKNEKEHNGRRARRASTADEAVATLTSMDSPTRSDLCQPKDASEEAACSRFVQIALNLTPREFVAAFQSRIDAKDLPALAAVLPILRSKVERHAEGQLIYWRPFIASANRCIQDAEALCDTPWQQRRRIALETAQAKRQALRAWARALDELGAEDPALDQIAQQLLSECSGAGFLSRTK